MWHILLSLGLVSLVSGQTLYFKPHGGATAANNILCPDKRGTCPDRNTCCPSLSGSYACCPLDKAVCCKDGIHCCPLGYQCNYKGKLCYKADDTDPWTQLRQATTRPLQQQKQQQHQQKQPQQQKQTQQPQQRGNASSSSTSSVRKPLIKKKMICPGGKTYCENGKTCCFKDKWHFNCCPFVNGVCCSDGAHCCPLGFTCEIKLGKCTKGGELALPWGQTHESKKDEPEPEKQGPSFFKTLLSLLLDTFIDYEQDDDDDDDDDDERDKAKRLRAAEAQKPPLRAHRETKPVDLKSKTASIGKMAGKGKVSSQAEIDVSKAGIKSAQQKLSLRPGTRGGVGQATKKAGEKGTVRKTVTEGKPGIQNAKMRKSPNTAQKSVAQQSKLTAAQKAKIVAAQKAKIAAAQQAKLTPAQKAKIAAAQKAKIAAAQKAKITAAQKANVGAVHQSKLTAAQKEKIIAAQKAKLSLAQQAQKSAMLKAKMSAAGKFAAQQAKMSAAQQAKMSSNSAGEVKRSVRPLVHPPPKMQVKIGVKKVMEPKTSTKIDEGKPKELPPITPRTKYKPKVKSVLKPVSKPPSGQRLAVGGTKPGKVAGKNVVKPDLKPSVIPKTVDTSKLGKNTEALKKLADIQKKKLAVAQAGLKLSGVTSGNKPKQNPHPAANVPRKPQNVGEGGTRGKSQKPSAGGQAGSKVKPSSSGAAAKSQKQLHNPKSTSGSGQPHPAGKTGTGSMKPAVKPAVKIAPNVKPVTPKKPAVKEGMTAKPAVKPGMPKKAALKPQTGKQPLTKTAAGSKSASNLVTSTKPKVKPGTPVKPTGGNKPGSEPAVGNKPAGKQTQVKNPAGKPDGKPAVIKSTTVRPVKVVDKSNLKNANAALPKSSLAKPPKPGVVSKSDPKLKTAPGGATSRSATVQVRANTGKRPPVLKVIGNPKLASRLLEASRDYRSEGEASVDRADNIQDSPLEGSAVVCPDGKSECPDGSTCCLLMTGQYGCCPLKKAVCCNDHQHCCPEGSTCDEHSEMCKSGEENIDWMPMVDARSTQVAGRQCADNKTSCPEHTTCCLMLDGYYACCPFENAKCCADKLHCCPSDEECDIEKGECVKKENDNSLLTPLSVAPVTSDDDIVCPDHRSCPAESTCCQITAALYGCCPFSNAVCCSDHTHCCPEGYTCDVTAGSCKSTGSSIPWLTKRVAQPIRNNDRNQPITAVDIKTTTNVDKVICPDKTSFCPDQTTCCLLQSGQYGCCPLPNAVCCADHQHCCPTGYKCDVKKSTCLKSEDIPWQPTTQPQPVSTMDTSVICPDYKSQCPDGQTCCLLESGQYGCCPVPNAVCCSDHLHCCPRGMVCDPPFCKSTTNSLTISWSPLNTRSVLTNSLLTQQQEQRASVTCQDKSVCPPGSTCCLMISGQYGCCPYTKGSCCADKLHCCPDGFQCDKTGKRCDKKDSSVTLTSTLFTRFKPAPPSEFTADVNNVRCPDGKEQCPDGNTCCKQPSGRYGCCPFASAVCCRDGIHCCPQGYACDPQSGSCTQSVPWLSKVPASRVPETMPSNSIICPDHQHLCPDSNTCCLLHSGEWGCCPLPKAVCCSDGIHCCPTGYTCDVQQGTCMRHGDRPLPFLALSRDVTSHREP